MVVVITNDVPPAVRGLMKLWFVEAKPGVFVSGINDSLANKVVDYLLGISLINAGMVVFQSINKAPWYKIRQKGNSMKEIVEFEGLQLLRKNTNYLYGGLN